MVDGRLPALILSSPVRARMTNPLDLGCGGTLLKPSQREVKRENLEKYFCFSVYPDGDK